MHDNAKCDGAVAVYDFFQIGPCVPLGYKTGFIQSEIKDGVNITIITYDTQNCTGPAVNSTVVLGACSTDGASGYTASYTLSLASNLSTPITKNAYGYSIYPSSTCKDKDLPVFRSVYNPGNCFSVGTRSVIFGTCNSTTSTIYDYSDTSCATIDETNVITLGTCYDGMVEECYGTLNLASISFLLLCSLCLY